LTVSFGSLVFSRPPMKLLGANRIRELAAPADQSVWRGSPLQLLDTDEGTREVETLLGRIRHRIAA
jgi:hypothetical protein